MRGGGGGELVVVIESCFMVLELISLLFVLRLCSLTLFRRLVGAFRAVEIDRKGSRFWIVQHSVYSI